MRSEREPSLESLSRGGRHDLIVTKLRFKDGRAKIEVRVARGKKLYDKRQTLRERDAGKEARTQIRNAKRGPS
jgi:SsrA-binding protein